MFTKSLVAAVALASLLLPQTLQAEGDLPLIAPSYQPNFFGVGVGGYPDYFGSDDEAFGAAPFGRFSWGERYFSFQASGLIGTKESDLGFRSGFLCASHGDAHRNIIHRLKRGSIPA